MLVFIIIAILFTCFAGIRNLIEVFRYIKNPSKYGDDNIGL